MKNLSKMKKTRGSKKTQAQEGSGTGLTISQQLKAYQKQEGFLGEDSSSSSEFSDAEEKGSPWKPSKTENREFETNVANLYVKKQQRRAERQSKKKEEGKEANKQV